MADEDTIQDEAQDDTVVASAEDTAQAVDDTVQADEGESPFAQFDEPEVKKPAEAPAPAHPVTVDQDDLPDTEIEEAVSEFAPDSKAAKLLRNLAKRDKARQAESKRQAESLKAVSYETSWNSFERSCGLDRASDTIKEKLTRDELQNRLNRHFEQSLRSGTPVEEARGEARATLRHEIKTILAGAGPKKKPLPRTKVTDTGATLLPPGGGGGRSVKDPKDPAKVFIDGDWDYPVPAQLDD